MNAAQYLKKAKAAYQKENGDTSFSQNGKRLRVTKECKELGDMVFEAGDTFFYSSQGNPDSVARIVSDYFPTVALEPVGPKSWTYASWPKESWVTQKYRIVEIEG